MAIKIFTTGGTIDKVYFDAASEFQVGESPINELFKEANVNFDFSVESILRKDSLEITDSDRELVRNKVAAEPLSQILVTHGTDTMATTAQFLKTIENKTIVFTGAMQPARLKASDAVFNIGFAAAAVQILPPGVYIAMNGEVFRAENVRKNREAQKFETI